MEHLLSKGWWKYILQVATASCHCEATNVLSVSVPNVEPANCRSLRNSKLEVFTAAWRRVKLPTSWWSERNLLRLHMICLQDMFLSWCCDSKIFAHFAKHVIKTHLSETGMFTRGWHFFCSYRFPLFRRGQWCQYVLCCKPLCQNTLLPFRRHRGDCGQLSPALGGVLSLLWHFPLTYISHPANMKAMWDE